MTIFDLGFEQWRTNKTEIQSKQIVYIFEILLNRVKKKEKKNADLIPKPSSQ